MPDITLVFGPNNSFFFDCPKSWKFHNVPPTLRQLFNSSMSPAWRIAQPYCLALAPQINSPEPIWFVGCKVLNGEDKIFYSQIYFDQNYPELSRWTKTIPNAPRACFVTFGANYSYFASAPGHGSIWAGVPTELSDKVQKAFDTPCCVSLGVKDAWFVLWPDGYYAWKFHANYAALDRILNEAEPRTVSYLAISPYNKDHYLVAFRNGTVKYSFVGAPKDWLAQMKAVFAEWQTEALQRQVYQQPYMSAPGPPQQQWNHQPHVPVTPATPGYPSPQVPNAPLVDYKHVPAPSMAPPGQFGTVPPRQPAVEMPGTMLAVAPAPPPPPPSLLPTLPPLPLPITPKTSTTEKRRSRFLSRLFD